MNDQKTQMYFFGFLLLATTVLMGLVFYPFLGVLALAAILAIILNPLFEKLKKILKIDWLSSLVVILLLAIFVIIPLILMGWQIFQEAQSLSSGLIANKVLYLDKINIFIDGPLKKIVPNFSVDLGVYLEKILSGFISSIGPLVYGATQVFFDVLLTIIALFFFLKDNEKIKKILIKISPLEDKYDNLIFEKIDAAVNSVMKGSLFIAILQSVIAGLGFWAVGIPSPTFWGTIGVIASIIPGLGITFVMLPAAIYLLLSGGYIAALGLIILNILIVISMDNFLRPAILKRGVPTYPVFILFSVLGGLSLFGPLGIIFGPVILSFYLTLLEIYQIIFRSE